MALLKFYLITDYIISLFIISNVNEGKLSFYPMCRSSINLTALLMASSTHPSIIIIIIFTLAPLAPVKDHILAH